MIKTALGLITAIHRWYTTPETEVLVVMPDGSEWFISTVDRPLGGLGETIRIICKEEKLPAPSYADPLQAVGAENLQ